jgi:hypothetical protein
MVNSDGTNCDLLTTKLISIAPVANYCILFQFHIHVSQRDIHINLK